MSMVNGEEEHLNAMSRAAKRRHSQNEYEKELEENNKTWRPLSLFDLPWEDILIPKVASYLKLTEIFSLRKVSKTAKRFAETALSINLKDLDMTYYESSYITLTFDVMVRNCTHLERLQLMQCRWLGDEQLQKLLKKNTRLRELNLSKSCNITALSLQPAIVGCKQLRKLQLAHCVWVSTGAIDALTLHHSNLEYIDLSGCIAIAERSLTLLMKKQTKLKAVYLESMPNVTDALLSVIAKYCPLLQILDLKFCTNFTDNALVELNTNCKHLHTMFIRGCPNISEHALAPLRRYVNIDRLPVGDFSIYGFYPNDFFIY